MMNKINYILLAMFLCVTAMGQNLQDENSTLIETYFHTQTMSLTTPIETLHISQQNTSSDVNVIQNGNYNWAYIVSNSKSKHTLNQQGDRNSYEYFTYYNSNPSTVNSYQLGDNNSIQVFGQNELSKNINIFQNTNDKTLIIKNY